MSFKDFHFKEYVTNWNDHLTSFWVPLILALIFLSLAITAFAKDKNIRMGILYLIFMAACLGYLAYGDALISKIAGLW